MRIHANRRHFLAGKGRNNFFKKRSFFRKNRIQRENTRVCRLRSRSQHENTGLFAMRHRFQRENTVSIDDFGFTIDDFSGSRIQRRDAEDRGGRIHLRRGFGGHGASPAAIFGPPSPMFAAPKDARMSKSDAGAKGKDRSWRRAFENAATSHMRPSFLHLHPVRHPSRRCVEIWMNWTIMSSHILHFLLLSTAGA